jgi:hypothetical protein
MNNPKEKIVKFTFREVLGFMNSVFVMESELEYEIIKDALYQTYNDLYLKIMLPFEAGILERDDEEEEEFNKCWVNIIEDEFEDFNALEMSLTPIRFTSNSYHYFFEEFFNILPTLKSEQYRIVIAFSKYSDKRLNETIKIKVNK